ncbi:hypothetical protein FLCU109888_00455 [Flavobacterium cucumis]|jgi:transcriptional regulator of heat shock response|uniref:Uncharacterized protein n=1 Tax=Flavobacterium cucumis TaxID=416016 RepID=A0A1M7ZU10_9FLAO|nr:hypothetical protein [Flavobacterium cucumis]SHO72346.1 hypothetical protein SAMN05443547_0677 [Flavobacterium cucumis]
MKYIIILFLTSFYYVKAQNVAEHFKTKQFEVAIFPESSYEIMPGKRFTPTKEEIFEAEKALKSKLKEANRNLENQYNSPIIHRNLKKYKRQYFGFINDKGEKILYINSLWKKNEEETKWLQQIIMVSDGGSHYWNIEYNLETDELINLSVNGSA